MKRILLIALVLLLTAVSAVPVLAEAQNSVAAAPQGAFSLVGKITDKGDQSITVKIWWGNTLVQQYRGQELEIQVDENTLFFFKQGTFVEPIDFSKLAVGQRVRVTGDTANDVWTASKITVQGAFFSLVGKIKAIGTDTITVRVWRGNIFARFFKGEDLTIQVDEDTLYFYKQGTLVEPIGFSYLTVGQRVKVKGRIVNDVWTASQVTVTGAKFSLVGKITAKGVDTFTVKVWRGNIFARPFKGEEIVITVTDATLYYLKEGTNITETTFDVLDIGQKVAVNGYVKNNTWEAYKVTVVIPLIK
jgi:hypothetical protein